MNTINNLFSELNKFSSEILALGEPLADIKVIENFEKIHNLKLPCDYKYFLSKHDGASLMGISIYGFTGIENLASVYEFEHNEIIYPQYHFLVPFSPDGGGNFYCFDTRNQSNSNESCPVVFWTSNFEYNPDNQPELTNSSFSEWIAEVMIGWTLESYNYDGSEKEQ